MTEIQDPKTADLYKTSKVLRKLSKTNDNEEKKYVLDTFSELMKGEGEVVWPNHTNVHKKDVEIALRVVAGARPTEEEVQKYEEATSTPHPRKHLGEVLRLIEEGVKEGDLPSIYE